MTTLEVVSKPEGTMLSHKVTWEEDLQASFELMWEVSGSDRNYQSSDAVATVGVALGDSLEDWLPGILESADCHEISTHKTDTSTEVRATFKTDKRSEINPLDEPTHWSGSFEEVEETVDYDLSDEPVLNSANVPYDPGLKRVTYRPTIKASKNFATFDPGTVFTICSSVNSSSYLGADPGTLRCKINWTDAFDSEVGTYYKFDFEFVYNPLGWTPAIVLSRGLQQIVDGELVQITDSENSPITEPVLLDEDGAVTSTPYFQEYDILPEYDFSSIGL